MTKLRTSPKHKSRKQKKLRGRLNVSYSLLNIFNLLHKTVLSKTLLLKSILLKTLLRKIGKGRVKKNASQKTSKACACNTCTPCKGRSVSWIEP